MGSRLAKAILLSAWMSALLGLVAMSIYFSGESTRFFGIADDQEQSIRFTTPVQIVRYGFVSGQEVVPGDLIVEVRRPDIDAELKIVHERIQALKFGNREDRASMEFEIVELRADLQAKLTEIDSQIRTLRSRHSAAQLFINEFDREANFAEDPAVRQEIASLEVRKASLERATAARVDDLTSRLTMPERTVDAQIAELMNRQRDLDRQQAELQVYAQRAGRVGSVLFETGDTVPPYQPVLTVHGSKPSYVNGYIHENVVNGVKLGQTVWVRSANSVKAGAWRAAVVDGLGSRIVEFPLRLKVNPLAQAWGREVTIRLDDDHALLLGEKVSVQLEAPILVRADFKALLARLSP